jgi:hypothetical protein
VNEMGRKNKPQEQKQRPKPQDKRGGGKGPNK